MSTDVATRHAVSTEIQEKVLIGGDLSKPTPAERLGYYQTLCRSLGVNPLSKPFEYIVLNDKLTLYAKKDCTDQLRESRDIDVEIKSRELIDDVFVVTARAKMNTGRQDESIGAVSLVKEDGEWKTAQSGKRYFSGNGSYKRLAPDDRANAMMKAETKAKRRVTLSICGLGLVDESELDTIRDKRRVIVTEEGTILDDAKPPEREAAGPETTPSELPPQASDSGSGPDDPAEPYRAKLRTCEQSVAALNTTYHAIPETIRQDCHEQYTKQLRAVGKTR